MTGRRFPHGYRAWHADANINYQLNRFLGGEPPDEVAALASRITTLADYTRELLAAACGRQAAAYWRAAEFFMSPGDPEKERAYDEFVRLFWDAHPGVERVRVRYGEAYTLPAFVLRAPRPAGTIVVHAGFDSHRRHQRADRAHRGAWPRLHDRQLREFHSLASQRGHQRGPTARDVDQ